MKGRKICLAAILILCSCGVKDLGEIYFDNKKTPEEASAGHLYATAISYDESYDWHKDSLGVNAEKKLLFIRDDKCILTLSCSALNRVDADADRYRILDGHLYTFFPSASDCTIKKDGKEILRIGKKEEILDIVCKDSTIYTLGVPSGGNGWTFRKNGTTLLSKPGGAPLGGLYEDRDSICFAYVEDINAGAEDVSHRYYAVCGTKIKQLEYGPDIQEVLAIRYSDGVLHYLAKSTAVKNGLLWQQGLNASSIKTSGATKLRNFSLENVGNSLVARGQIYCTDEWIYRFWQQGSINPEGPLSCNTFLFCGDTPSLCFAWQAPRTGAIGLSWNDCETRTFENDYRLITPYALASNKTDFALALSRKASFAKDWSARGPNITETPIIITRTDTLSYTFNGYFTRLTY